MRIDDIITVAAANHAEIDKQTAAAHAAAEELEAIAAAHAALAARTEAAAEVLAGLVETMTAVKHRSEQLHSGLEGNYQTMAAAGFDGVARPLHEGWGHAESAKQTSAQAVELLGARLAQVRTLSNVLAEQPVRGGDDAQALAGHVQACSQATQSALQCAQAAKNNQ